MVSGRDPRSFRGVYRVDDAVYVSEIGRHSYLEGSGLNLEKRAGMGGMQVRRYHRKGCTRAC